MQVCNLLCNRSENYVVVVTGGRVEVRVGHLTLLLEAWEIMRVHEKEIQQMESVNTEQVEDEVPEENIKAEKRKPIFLQTSGNTVDIRGQVRTSCYPQPLHLLLCPSSLTFNR